MPTPVRFLRRLRRELRRGLLPLWILETLVDGPTYGYALMARLNARAGADHPIGPSTIYPALAHLRSAGLVTAYHGQESLGPVRKYYAITDVGRAMLPEALALAAAVRGTEGAGAPTARPGPRARFA